MMSQLIGGLSIVEGCAKANISRAFCWLLWGLLRVARRWALVVVSIAKRLKALFCPIQRLSFGAV